MRGLKRPRHLEYLPTMVMLGFCALSILVLVSRIQIVDERFGSIMGMRREFALAVLRHDSVILGLLLACLIPALVLRSRILGFLFKAGSLLVLLFYLSDLLVFRVFNLRLFVEDILIYGLDTKSVLFMASSVLGSAGELLLPIVLLSLVGALLSFLLLPLKSFPRLLAGMSAMVLVFAVIAVAAPDLSGANAWVVENVLEVNRPNGLARPYGPEKTARALNGSCLGEVDTVLPDPPGDGRPDIILVLFESLSLYQTRLFSETRDIVPRFDSITRRGTAFTDFFSNGFNTDDGLIALLTGIPPLPTTTMINTGDRGGFDGFFGISDSLPRRLRDMGYHTVFVTSGDLDFSMKGQWLLSIGFDQILGHDEPYFNGMERYHFLSVTDRALYENIIYNVLPDLQGSRPYFLVIENVSTHHPFWEPETGSTKEEEVFRYADTQLGWLYDNLEAEGFLRDGLLIITSDHRSMTPLRSEEFGRFRDEARARIPLVFLGRGQEPGRVVEGYFQQTDLPASVLHLLGEEAPLSGMRGNLLSNPPVPSRYVIYYGGQERDKVWVFGEDGTWSIRLDGDRTEFLQNRPSDGDSVLDFVNCVRIQAEARNGR
ncbi:MAG: LTA synthase family protein [bacterium]|nr:MAG: LTA synthase family protein [bacterium]